MTFLFTSFFYVHKLSAWLFLGAAMRFFGLWYYLLGLLLLFVQGRAPLKGFVYGRPTRGSPPLQGMPLLKISPPDCFKIHLFRSSLRIGGFRRLQTATIGASRPPRPPRQSSRALQPHFFDKRRSFVRERNKQGSCRRQLLGNSAKPTFHTSLHPALFNF